MFILHVAATYLKYSVVPDPELEELILSLAFLPLPLCGLRALALERRPEWMPFGVLIG